MQLLRLSITGIYRGNLIQELAYTRAGIYAAHRYVYIVTPFSWNWSDIGSSEIGLKA